MCIYGQPSHTQYQVMSNTWYQVRVVTGTRGWGCKRGYWILGGGEYQIRVITYWVPEGIR